MSTPNISPHFPLKYSPLKTRITLSLLAVSLLALLTALAAAPTTDPHDRDYSTQDPPSPPAIPGTDFPTSSGFELLKSLAGAWVMLDENGQPGEDVILSYRVIANGSAVVESDFPGTEHEMLTVFHHDGDDFILTHYCMLGNQPQ